jgi:hypothetical protein
VRPAGDANEGTGHPSLATLEAVPPEYLLELHWRDGRIEPRPSSEFEGWSPLEVGAQVEINGTWWRIRDVLPGAGYEAKVVLDEE